MKVQRLCRLYGVTAGGYYAWRKRDLSAHDQYDLILVEAIKELHQGFRRSYGAPRVHQALRQQGYPCSVRRINRLMKSLGIKASTTGLYAWRPGQHELYSASGNQLAQAASPNRTGGSGLVI